MMVHNMSSVMLLLKCQSTAAAQMSKHNIRTFAAAV